MGLLRRLARARLAARVMRRLRRAGVTGARYDAHTFQLCWTPPGDDAPTIVELAHFTSSKKKDIDHHLAGLLPAVLPPAWSAVRPLLRPVLRGVTPGAPLRRPVLPFLYEHVVVDHPETMIYVTADQPSKWGVRPEDVFAAARANLSGAVLQGEATEPVVVHFVDDGDSYWVSHLLLEHWLERLAPQVGGSPVAFAPDRGTLLVTADGSRHLPALFAQAEEIYAKSLRPITPMAYVSDAHGCTIPYKAPRGHPLHHAASRAERILAIQQYTLQKAEISDKSARGEAAADVDGADVDAGGTTEGSAGTGRTAKGDAGTVRAAKGNGSTGRAVEGRALELADIELVGDEVGGWRTKAIWERDEAVLLPEADEVQLGDRIVAWAELARHLSRAPGFDPRRWAADGWPVGR
ncbi:hypothetical protein ACGFJ7_39100 [Actinoplanes sp. NPDC048988]|uniref:hypothetical protein n=1 Tax=Actinoplanes sp. NPDC048988 TaxID=3363901 RepID=UPI0037198047